MKKMLAFSLAGYFLFSTQIIMFKFLGFTVASILGQPAQFFLLVIPMGAILMIFHVVLTVMYKPINKLTTLFKWITLINIPIVSLCNIFAGQIYILASTSMMNLIWYYLLAINVLFVMLFILYITKTRKAK